MAGNVSIQAPYIPDQQGTGTDDGPPSFSPQDRDMMVRTVIGEAGNQPPEGQAAVAHVILNRQKDGKFGKTPTDVVLAPHQFEPWGTRGKELMSYAPNSPQYQDAAKIVDGAITGQIKDPTGGATHFLNPDIVQARYGHLPSWAQGDGQTIGDHVFYKPASKNIRLAQNEKTTPLSDVMSPAAAPSASPLSEVLTNNKTEPKPVEVVTKPGDQWQAAEIEKENSDLAGSQFTSPYHSDYKPEAKVGEAIIGDDNQAYTKGPDGKWVPTDKNKHVVMRDPNTGKYEVFNRTERSELNPVLGRAMMAGRLINEGAATVPLGGIGKATGAAAKAANATTAIEKSTGVKVVVPKTAVATEVPHVAARALSHVPGASGPLARGAENLRSGLEQATAETAKLPTTVASGPEAAGEAARFGINQRIQPTVGEGADKTKGIFAQRVADAYDAAEKFDKNEVAPINSVRAVAKRIWDEWSATKQGGVPPGLEKVIGALKTPGGITYTGMKRLRSEIGEMLSTGNLSPGMNEGDLKSVYGALTDDMKRALEQQGGKRAVAAWEKANSIAEVTARNKNKLGRILGVSEAQREGAKSDEAIFNVIHRMAGSASTADAKTLALAKRSMSPSEWGEITSAVVTKMGRNTKGEFDPSAFVRDYNRLSPAGKNQLFGPAVRKSLDAIAHLSGEPWAKAAEVAHPPGELAHYAGLFGVFHRMKEAIGIGLGANAMSRVLSRPNTAENAARFMENYKLLTLKPTKVNVIAFNNAARALTKDVAEEARKDIGTAIDKVEGVAGYPFKKVGELATYLYEGIKVGGK